MRVTLSLESRFESIEIAERALMDLVGGTGVTDEEEYWILTALREAIANAIRHGHRTRPEESVRVDFRVDEERLFIDVLDHGDGFDSSAIPDPRDAENILKPCGRGIFYMRRFMDEVTFRRELGGGTMVSMSRRLIAEPSKE